MPTNILKIMQLKWIKDADVQLNMLLKRQLVLIILKKHFLIIKNL